MNELAKLSFAKNALMEAKTLNELKEIRDIARAVKTYAAAKKLGTEIKNEASEVEIRATREMGKLIEQKQDAGELATQETGRGDSVKCTDKEHFNTLPEIGITRKESSTSKNLASIPDEKFEENLNEFKDEKKPLTMTAMLRKIAQENTSEDIILPDGTYRIIYADPPWKYADRKEYRPDGAAENHYPSMTINELCNMTMPKTEENAVLYIWATSPMLEDVFKVINSWGFKYKTSFVWDKIKHNMGHYNSVRHEFLLIATRGSCLPDDKQLFDSVQSIERAEHSGKPEQFRNIIDTNYTYGNRIELFARKITNGWDSFGNQL